MPNPDRRTFIKLGAATVASSIVTSRLAGQTRLQLHPSVNEETFRMPGNTTIPGAEPAKQWPDLKKYEGVTKTPGMCQLCSTICAVSWDM